MGGTGLTSDGKLRAAGGELQEIPALGWGEFTHGLQQILDALAVHVEPVIGLDRIHKCC